MLGEPHFTSCLMSTIHKSAPSRSIRIKQCSISIFALLLSYQNKTIPGLLEKTLGNVILQESSSRQLYCFPSLPMGFYGLGFAPVLGINEGEARECIKLQKCNAIVLYPPPPPLPPPPASRFSNKNGSKL